MNIEELKKIIVSQNSRIDNENIIEREKMGEIEKMIDYEEIIIISGIRRSGKSVLLQSIRKKNKQKDYFVNFDDDRLSGFSVEDFEKLYIAFIELYGEQDIYYFDEIQNIIGWELFVRRLYNEGKKVYITGSNASMLSKELGTHLTGRNIRVELYPLNFKEFLKFNSYNFNNNDLYNYEKLAKIKNYFKEYTYKGGFAQFLKNNDEKFFKDLYENILYKDVVVRYNLKQEKTIKEMVHYLISNTSKEISYTKLKNILGLSSATTVKEYIGYFENSYMLFELIKFDYSLKKQLVNPKKIYVIDSGLSNSISFQFSENIGRNLENLVFIELKRRNNEIYYHREKKECDFVVQKKGQITEAIQVSYSLEDSETKKREVEGLIDAMITHELEEGIILTYDEEYEIPNYEFRIKVIPIWKWLLLIK